VLLDALMTAKNRAARRKLLDLLPLTDLDVAPLIVAKLEDERWYVQRNLLLLLERLRRVPPGFSATRWTQHPDARVRYQALALQLTLPEERESALRAALEDHDKRVTRLGLLAYQQRSSRSVTPLVAHIAMHPHMIDELRIHAIRALGQCRERAALDALLSLADGGKSVLGKPKLAPPTPIVLAAIQALAEVWSTDRQASDVLALARGSSDPVLRQAAGAA
jgi:HEAT repeat protein